MIEIKNLDFGYKTKKVFSNINLTFNEGCIYGLLGENGVGKTTLLKIIGGLQKPSTGNCHVDGIDSYKRLPETMSKIYFISEDFATPQGTAIGNVKSIGRFYPNFDFNLFVEICNEMEVDPSRKFSEMSFGQQKKCLIATALSLNTEYLLLDEPTNGLDIPSKSLFRQVIASHVSERRTIIISTHQVKDIESLIDPIIILEPDKVLLNASFEEITNNLYFDYSIAKDPDAIYSEVYPGGCINVCLNPEHLESHVNIEALFNAVTKNQNIINGLFNK